MPNAVKYNTGTTLTNSIRKNQLSFGVNSIGYGPTSSSRWYSGISPVGFLVITDSFSVGATTQANAYPIFWGTAGSTNTDLLNLINALPARDNQTEFTTLADAVTWIEGTGTYGILNNDYEDIVTSGLTFLTDGSNTLSYPLVNNTLYDIANDNSSVSGTLSFVTDNLGYLSFDGTSNSSVFSPIAAQVIFDNITINTWFYVADTYTSHPIIGIYNTQLTFVTIWKLWINAGILSFTTTAGTVTSTATILPGEWHNVCVTFGSGTVRYYVDGSFVDSDSLTTGPGSGGIYIGYDPLTSDYFAGGIGVAAYYNRVLSATEILKNYNAQSYRYTVNPTPTPTPTVTPTPSRAPISIQQTDTTFTNGSSAGCSGRSAASVVEQLTAAQGGTAGSLTQTFSLTSAQTNVWGVQMKWSVPAGTNWSAGSWTWRLNITAANSNITLTEVYICRINSSDVSQATIGSATGLGISLSTTGVKSGTITGTAQTASSGDYVNIVFVFTNAAMTTQSTSFTMTQLINTPFT